MSLPEDIDAAYSAHGPAAVAPFIGCAYEDGTPSTFRTLVLGINSYISEPDWPSENPASMRLWFRDWWAQAARQEGGTHAFYTKAWNEASKLATTLAEGSSLFQGLRHDADPSTKAVKEYLRGDEYKDAKNVTPAMLEKYRPTWHAELDVLARHGVLPHLIVVLGEQVWETAWQAFHKDHDRPRAFEVVEYTTPGVFEDPIHHHANRLVLKTGDTTQTTLLVRYHHPSKWGPDQKRAEWLLAEPKFRELARLG